MSLLTSIITKCCVKIRGGEVLWTHSQKTSFSVEFLDKTFSIPFKSYNKNTIRHLWHNKHFVIYLKIKPQCAGIRELERLHWYQTCDCARVSGNWKDYIDSKLVIVRGYPGTGKTTLIADHQYRNKIFTWGGFTGKLVYYHFPLMLIYANLLENNASI